MSENIVGADLRLRPNATREEIVRDVAMATKMAIERAHRTWPGRNLLHSVTTTDDVVSINVEAMPILSARNA